MVQGDAESDGLDRVLDALANPHRRAIVHSLGLQPYAISQLAQMRELSLPAIHKHLRILEDANLIQRRKHGRTTVLILNRHALQQLQIWVDQFHPHWGSDEATYENYTRFLAATHLSKPDPVSEGEPPP